MRHDLIMRNLQFFKKNKEKRKKTSPPNPGKKLQLKKITPVMSLYISPDTENKKSEPQSHIR